jgi:nucleotide-binding universal stress UspA family protein
MLAIRTVLHPTDFSEYSGPAFRLACSLARDSGARLILLHVGERPVIAPVEGVVPPEPEQFREELTAKLDALRAEEPEVPVEIRLMIGADPAAEIVRVAEQTGSDLIVMGTHGRTGLGRLLMGSVADQVVRRAPCPVATVKHPLPEPPACGGPISEAARPAAETMQTAEGD